ncbi:hypothetical protein LD39_03885 [Halobacillus sp. BBL2006]|nr:hypothetical protein LD39_03885 [Halobacillus sp. BBL2006]
MESSWLDAFLFSTLLTELEESAEQLTSVNRHTILIIHHLFKMIAPSFYYSIALIRLRDISSPATERKFISWRLWSGAV